MTVLEEIAVKGIEKTLAFHIDKEVQAMGKLAFGLKVQSMMNISCFLVDVDGKNYGSYAFDGDKFQIDKVSLSKSDEIMFAMETIPRGMRGTHYTGEFTVSQMEAIFGEEFKVFMEMISKGWSDRALNVKDSDDLYDGIKESISQDRIQAKARVAKKRSEKRKATKERADNNNWGIW